MSTHHLHVPSMRLQDWLLISLGSAFKFTLLGFYLVAIMTILKAFGYSLQQLSWVYLLGITEAAKILFALLVERWQSSPLGRFRFWLLLTSSGMIVILLVMMLLQPQHHFIWLMILCLTLSILSVIFGCALIGLASVLMPFRMRGYGGSIQVMAARLGKILGGAGVLWLYHWFGWTGAVGMVLGFAVLMFVCALYYHEPAVVRSKIHTLPPSFRQLCQQILVFWQNKHNGKQWFILLFVSCMPYAAIAATFVPKLADLGWQPQQTGTILSIIIPILSLPTAIFGGMLAKYYSRHTLTTILLGIQTPILTLFMLTDVFAVWHQWLAVLPIVLLSMGYTLLLPTVTALIIDRARPQYATLDNALQLSVMATGGYLSGFMALRLAAISNYEIVYALSALAACGVTFGAWFVLQNAAPSSSQ